MTQKNYSELNDQELLHEAKKAKSNAIGTALFIGFLIGIVIYSVVVNTWGLVTLVPLYIAYKLIKDSKKDSDLEKELKARNLN